MLKAANKHKRFSTKAALEPDTAGDRLLPWFCPDSRENWKSCGGHWCFFGYVQCICPTACSVPPEKTPVDNKNPRGCHCTGLRMVRHNQSGSVPTSCKSCKDEEEDDIERKLL